jgi:hypothetical protein
MKRKKATFVELLARILDKAVEQEVINKQQKLSIIGAAYLEFGDLTDPARTEMESRE